MPIPPKPYKPNPILEPHVDYLGSTSGFSGFLRVSSAIPLDSSDTQWQSRLIAGFRLSDARAADLALAPARYTQYGNHDGVRSATPEATAETAREVLRCDHCKLVQFRTRSPTCSRCKKSLEVEKPVPTPAPLCGFPRAPSRAAKACRSLPPCAIYATSATSSQRQLAARMNVPRTYISKIENGKAMPTLSSLDRLARALRGGHLRPPARRHHPPLQRDRPCSPTDPFLAEIAAVHLASSTPCSAPSSSITSANLPPGAAAPPEPRPLHSCCLLVPQSYLRRGPHPSSQNPAHPSMLVTGIFEARRVRCSNKNPFPPPRALR